MSRKIAREELFKLLFEADMNKVTPLKRLEEFLKEGNRKSETEESYVIQEFELSKGEIAFIREYAEGIDKYYGQIDGELEERMEEWSLATVGNVERSLLRFGAYELLYKEIGHEIVLNEIVELAKVYGDQGSHEFVNGVLAKFVK